MIRLDGRVGSLEGAVGALDGSVRLAFAGHEGRIQVLEGDIDLRPRSS